MEPARADEDDDELWGLAVEVTGVTNLLGLVPADERCDGVGIAVALNVELVDLRPVLLYDVDDLTSLMHVAAAADGDDDAVPAVDRLTRCLLADTLLTSQFSIDDA